MAPVVVAGAVVEVARRIPVETAVVERPVAGVEAEKRLGGAVAVAGRLCVAA